ncbi:MAG: protein kinase, partial [Halobacteriales archaeon]|nr:protein kinase [Halobacteriales archaeon]
MAPPIAAALQVAHGQGVIHRDIKPANILLSHGEPLIADFGIALAVQEAGGGRLTETGLSIGTPFYMSPEQATGDRHPDARSDIYSLGTLLYEMLTGEPPFQGATAQAVLGKILTGSPTAPTEYRRSIPTHVEAVILKSLERLPADRFGSAAEFGEALGNPAFRHGTGANVPVDEGSTPPEAVEKLQKNVRALAAAVVVTGMALIWSLLGDGAAPMDGNPAVEFLIVGDSTHGITSGTPGSVALDPETGMVGYVGVRPDGGRQIFVRALDDRTPRPIPGTEDAHDVFFSPDGAWIGFTTVSQNELYKIRLAGGSRIHLATLPGSMAGATWGDDDAIYYGVTGPPGLMRVPAAGGEPVEILEQSTTLLGVIDPHTPPQSDLVLFTGLATDRGATVQGFRPSTGEVRVLGPGMTPRYVQGRLVYATSTGVVLAEPFDLSSLEFTGQPVQVATGVGGWIDLSRDMTTSRSGTIAYVEGGAGNSSLMVSEGPVGTELRSGGNMYAPRASPDGDRILHVEASGSTMELYIYSRSQRTNRLIHAAPYIVGGDWSPDGETVIVASGADLLDFDLFLVSTDGSAAPRLFRDLPPDQGTTVPEFSPDGTWVVWNGAREGEGLQTNAVLIAPVDGEDNDVRRIVDDG